MSLWDRLMGEFIDVIDWVDSSNDTMVWRFERHGNEIKYGAKLTVREGQTAVFVNEGRLADVFPPGMYLLETKNLPILSTILHWDHGFQSPFKAEVYFVSTRRFTDLKWGTKNPIMLRDAEFGPVRLRAFGTYEVRVADPTRFLREIVGTDGHFTTDELTDQLRNLIVSRFATVLGASGIPALDLAANYQTLGRYVTDKIAGDFLAYGIELTNLLVENVSLPPEVEAALDRRTSMGVVGDLDRYTRFQSAEALRTAAANPGGAAGAGVGIGAGVAMGQTMGAALGGAAPWGARSAPQQPAATPPPPPPPPAGPVFWIAAKGERQGPFDMGTLKGLAREGKLTPDTLVWTDGMEGWEKASAAPSLSVLFGAMPPPLPGA
ncbi:SPFH domain-containing protein [Futiania mangrovi]|uniref:SPFH domain-containing protein n=1 Tax=Futiania mangrovi TaxID=2959716 RepID=A0A9J6P9N5_9PROT|nr:SPFH domain-containing protein [Futiania mangrovii]MCP1335001.1 SPFH domain-containing protein [Futiania mangrovii]